MNYYTIGLALRSIFLFSGVAIGLASSIAQAADAGLPAVEPVSSMPIPKISGVDPAPPVRCVKWDYWDNPISVGGKEDSKYEFDGYPTSLSQPYPSRNSRVFAFSPEQPFNPDQPPFTVIDYKRPVAVTRFIHYFDRFRNPAAWRNVEVSVSDDGQTWKPLQEFKDLSIDCPQVLGIDAPVAARFYKITVQSLAPGATVILTHEIETYYGATLGNVTSTPAEQVQSEAAQLSVRVVSPDAPVEGGTLKLIAPDGSLQGALEIPLPKIEKGGSSVGTFAIAPLHSGPIPIIIEFYAGGHLIDKRPYTIHVRPKLVLKDVTPAGAVTAATGSNVAVEGILVNAGTQSVADAKVTWLGVSTAVGALAPGQSAKFALSAKVTPGCSEGQLEAVASGQARTVVRRPVICRTQDRMAFDAGTFKLELTSDPNGIRVSVRGQGTTAPMTGMLNFLIYGKPLVLEPIGTDAAPALSAAVPGGVLQVSFRDSSQLAGTPEMTVAVIPDDPNPATPPWLDLEMRLKVDDPKIMFRPQIDWYTVEHGPNWPHLHNGHNSATRMLCIQTGNGTISMVPDTDNMQWGFTPENEMTASFQIPLTPHDPLGQGIWRPVAEAPMAFDVTLPVLPGNWWDAYRHVAQKVFKFEQPRQWAMPISQMQMLATRCLMSSQAWSEKWQTVRSFAHDVWFMNFYGAQFTLPALQSWYLATDDPTAKIKAEKVAEWLMRNQYNEGPMAGAWFSVYFDKGQPELVGSDFIQNRWFVPQATGATVQTLLWYWHADGRKNDRVLAAAKRGCEWMLKTLRADGGWPYAFDLEGKTLTDQCGAGQIWCTWALWTMYEITHEERYKEAALRSKDFFKKTYMDQHRYVGYWEDTVGITKEQNQKINSWESYEAALAVHVFSRMGDKALAVEAAKDLACHTWTRTTSTRDYETSMGQTTEQSTCGPSQAQCPMVGAAFSEIYRLTSDPLWRDLSGATKAINFCADPDRGYAMVATSGWVDALHGVAGPPYANVRPFVAPNMSRTDYGREIWFGWVTDQFAWLGLEWLVREGNLRAPQYVAIDWNTYRGTVLDAPGRVKLSEEKCDVTGIDHYDINWIGYQNDTKYMLLVMNHKEKVTVAIRPHEAHLGVYSREPKILIGGGNDFKTVTAVKQGVQYMVEIPAGATALLIWDRIK